METLTAATPSTVPISTQLASRARAASLHLLLSLCVAAGVAVLVFGLWYPGAYRQLSGGRDLFLLVTTVDVILGPLLTFAVFDRRKGWPHLRRDLAVIGLLQLAALGYGLQTVQQARPIAMVFEVDRFRVLATDQIDLAELPKAPAQFQALPWTGPWLLGARRPEAGQERNDAMFRGVSGVDIGQRPMFWRPYAESRSAALAKARPLPQLLQHYAPRSDALRQQVLASGVDPEAARFLPVMARGDWVAVLDAEGEPRVFLQVDGFF